MNGKKTVMAVCLLSCAVAQGQSRENFMQLKEVLNGNRYSATFNITHIRLRNPQLLSQISLSYTTFDTNNLNTLTNFLKFLIHENTPQ